MFGLFKSNPTAKLRKKMKQIQEKSMQAQRRGDIRSHSMLSAEADELWKEIQRLEGSETK